MKKVLIKEWLVSGWKLTIRHWKTYILYSLIAAFVSDIAGLIFYHTVSKSPILTLFISNIVMVPFICGFYRIFIKQVVNDEKINIKDLFKGFEVFVPSNIATLVILIFTGLGAILLIIPGFIVAALYTFTLPLIMEKRLGFWTAMEKSRKTIWKNWAAFTIFGIISFIILIIGSLTIVGIFIIFPWIIASTTYAYKDWIGFGNTGDSQ